MNLSILSMEVIFPHLDANKRIQLSMNYSSIRTMEKSVPLKVESLNFHNSCVTINSTTYRLGEIVDIPDEMADDTIRTTNNSGGFDWWTQGGEVIEPGDIQFEDQDYKYLESQKYQIWKNLRSCFMKALEKYLDGEHLLNPMSFLYREDWHEAEWKFDRVFDKFNAGLPTEISALSFFLSVRDVEGRQEYETEQEYLRAFEVMKKRLNEMRDNGNQMSSDVLRKLTYLPKKLPMFTAFSMVENWDYYERRNARKWYSRRIPENITPRRAFKQFTCAVLGGRPPIQAESFCFENMTGIFGLPEGLRVIADTVELSSGADFLNAYKTILSDVNSMFIAFPIKAEIFELNIVQNCRGIILNAAFTSNGAKIVIDSIESLMSKSIYVRDIERIGSNIENLNLIIGNWSKNPNRKIGSKLYVETLLDISVVFDSEHLRQLGFRNGNNEGKRYLYLCHENNKKVVLTEKEDTDQLPTELERCFGRGGYTPEYYFYLEVVL